ncbi:hypothetical protein KDC22_30220 [Paenibacillus tritici]|jgi:hypothetical protein|uniref:hypothetical protein n=1 Tax=Paenibacillus tritici TaxID=1873425 RepID=UPI001BAC8DFB|nr:hypothetical protein [Paenibacillus tritici]QUL54504.1 hypothetical protein KDC22_30220 [Paenibacillus tritici]
MLRIGYLSAALNLATAIVSFLRFGSNEALLIMAGYTLLILAGYRLLRNQGVLTLIPLLTFSCFFLIYNVIYVFLKQLHLIDLYAVDWRLEVQLALPLLLGFTVKSFLKRSGKSRFV